MSPTLFAVLVGFINLLSLVIVDTSAKWDIFQILLFMHL